jgi:hypothetical protein
MRSKVISFLAVAIALCDISLAHSASCVTQSAPARVRLVELYTSEGCSSCPPADRWLSHLNSDPGWIALAFHVDYWDAAGWRDRFSDARFTSRQNEVAERVNKTTIYTPEFVLDGREWKAWSNGIEKAAADPATARLTLHTDLSENVHVRLESRFEQGVKPGGYRAYFALSEDGLSSQVKGGENRGVLLRHDHVVRVFVGPLELDNAETVLKLPDDLQKEKTSIIAFVQNPQTGKVAQVIGQALAACSP